MARRIRTLLLIAGAFVVMTAGACPPEFCEAFPEICGGVPGQADSGPQPDSAPQPELQAGPNLVEVDPDEGRT